MRNITSFNQYCNTLARALSEVSLLEDKVLVVSGLNVTLRLELSKSEIRDIVFSNEEKEKNFKNIA